MTLTEPDIKAIAQDAEPIPELDRYFAAPDGSIYSTRWRQAKRLRASPAGRGYLKVSLRVGDAYVTMYVHYLVLRTFVGPCPEGMEARHLNGNMLDNRLDNLAWGTPAENLEDRRRHGTFPIGTGNPSAKLDDDKVREIRRMVAAGRPHTAIARQFGVAQSQIWLIKTGQTWSHVQ